MSKKISGMELPGKTSHRSDILLLQSERAYIVEWAMTEASRSMQASDQVVSKYQRGITDRGEKDPYTMVSFGPSQNHHKKRSTHETQAEWISTALRM